MISSEIDPSNPVFAASSWLKGALTGTIATTIAVLAIATVGLLMLSGRIDVRRSTWVIVGCFIIFGASGIAVGIHSAIAGRASSETTAEIDSPYYPPASPTGSQSVPASSDPYAGAAVPRP